MIWIGSGFGARFFRGFFEGAKSSSGVTFLNPLHLLGVDGSSSEGVSEDKEEAEGNLFKRELRVSKDIVGGVGRRG